VRVVPISLAPGLLRPHHRGDLAQFVRALRSELRDPPRGLARVGPLPAHLAHHQVTPTVQVLTLGENGYAPGAAAVAGTELTASVEEDRPFSISFDPASLLTL
jgi:hypothetical protein